MISDVFDYLSLRKLAVGHNRTLQHTASADAIVG